MDSNIFAELSVVIVIGVVVSIILRLIRQPLIIGYIITGLIVGPSVMNLVSNDQTINVFASIGVALLLFIIGLGLNPKVVKEVGKVAVITGTLQIIFTVAIGFIVSHLLGYSKTESIVIGLALAFSSTIIILKLLSDKKEQTRLYGKIAIGILLIQDIAATIVLVLILARSDNSFSPETLILLALKGLAIAIPLFLISGWVLPKMGKIIASNQELLYLFAIGWGFGVATLFEHFGFSIEVGALFAGVALANLPYVHEIASRLRPLRDFFVVVFFISLGTRLNFGHISDIWLPITVLCLIVVLIKPFITMVIMSLMGYTKSTSFKASSALAQISEFSLVLVILAQQQNLLRQEIVNIITIVALITIAASAYIITYSRSIYSLLEKKITLMERRKTKPESSRSFNYDMILFGYNKGGQEFIKTMKQMSKRFIVVDYDPEVVDLIANRNVHFIFGDATDLELLEEINLSKAKLVVSTIGDYNTNVFLARWLKKSNHQAVFICAADTAKQASDLYDEGVSYVIMPHYVGSEKISSFIKRNGFNKGEFKRFRDKHLLYLQTHYQ